MRKISLFILALAVCVGIVVTFQNVKTAAPKPGSIKSKQMTPFNKQQFSLDSPSSQWVIVNKQRALNPIDYAPTDLRIPNVALRSVSTSDEMKLRAAPASALEKMFIDAKSAKHDLLLVSGYRSYSLQVSVYNRYVSTQGKETADTQSARPGHSEHQTGLAIDVGNADRSCELSACFAESPAGKWVAENAYKYGFLIRYQKDTQATVGYIYEPWHLRYVGTSLSTEIHRLNNQPLETFFGLPSAPTY